MQQPPVPDICIVLSTCPREKAGSLARALVERRVAACVNVIEKVASFYWWEGKLCEDGESLLVMKTPCARVEALLQAVRELHPYQVPEVVALPVITGHEPYLRWVEESVRH
ncbi:MAG: divalent-cation tolerance protein CutA [Planctomycetes bacterium]|nr:divalent-cation tolerance protein CutA [Planctomycetota bacterium]